jgi:putative cardiolipin synthase
VDDMDARAKNAGFAGLDAHPRIAVRMFNPFLSRRGQLSQVAEMVGSFNRINHRMHNKTWIADNRIAVAGGRNLGDEYFGASEDVNFVDLDFALVGPIVRDASASFDRYWNAKTTWPLRALDPGAVNEEALARVRTLLAEHAVEAEKSLSLDHRLTKEDYYANVVPRTVPLVFNIRMDPFESYDNKDSYGHLMQKVSWLIQPMGELMAAHLKSLADYPPGPGRQELRHVERRPGVHQQGQAVDRRSRHV